MTAIVIWQGNKTAIEIKDVVVQVTCLLLIGLSALELLSEDKILISKSPLVILSVAYGILMTAAYVHTNRCSLNDQAVLPQLFGIAIFILIIRYFSKDDIGKLIGLSVGAAVICSIYGILQYFRLDPLDWENIGAFGTLRVVSFFGNKNYFAIFLLLMIPLGGYIAVTSERKGGIFIGIVSTLCMIIALALSYSKGAFVAFFLSVIISAGLFILKKRETLFKGKKVFKRGFLSLFIPLILIIAIAGLSPDIRRDYTKRLKLRDHYIRQRMSYYQSAAEIIKKHPFWGVGPGNFAISYRQNEKYRINTYNPNYVLNHVHNDFLEIWVEYGLFALLAYMGILSVFLYEWAKGFKNSDDPDRQMVFILIFCSLSGYLFYSLLTVAGRYTSSVFYFWLVMGIGYLYITPDENRFVLQNRLKGNKRRLLAAGLIIVLILGVACKKILANYVSDVYMSKAYGFASQGNYDDALKYLNHAIRLRDKSVEAYYQRGFVHFSENRIDRAIEDYNKVSEMAPNYVNVDFNLAACFYKKKDWANTIRLANMSHRLFPDYLPNMMMLAYTYHYMGKHQKSLRFCDLILKRYKGHQPALKFRQKLEGILKQEGGEKL